MSVFSCQMSKTILEIFMLLPMKSSQRFLGSKDGLKFWWSLILVSSPWGLGPTIMQRTYPAQCYQIELRWRFEIWFKCFQKWKKRFYYVFCIHIEWIWSDYTAFLYLNKIHDCIILNFEENGCFTNKKGIEKIS